MRLPGAAAPIIDFPPFQLDLRAGQLRCGPKPVPLRPKTIAVLQHLAERPAELVTKQELLDAVWGDVAVSEDVVRLSVGELREALGDERSAPRFIETVPRRGYRFIAQMGGAALHAGSIADEPAGADAAAADDVVVGREGAAAEIVEWLRVAAGGRRQLGFVSGEAGIGKTTLVDKVLRDLQSGSGARLRIGRGQCAEHYGGGEPYLPVLEALTQLCRSADGGVVEGLLRDHAPEWLVDAMGLPSRRGVDRTQPLATTHEHTLHRLAATLEAIATETPLVLVLEDLQWSDYSTLDLLSVVARRREPARLLVLCTLRPADAIVRGHPVAGAKRELLRQGLGREILLGGLSPAAVETYLATRFAGATLPADLLPLLIDRSEGNPFFIVALIDHLLGQGLLVRSGDRWDLRAPFDTLRTTISDELRAVIEPRLERLDPDELRVLEAASVAGAEFVAHAVARSARTGGELADVEYVEQLCDALMRRQEILRAAGDGTWADGSTSARYAFRHALYQQVIYQRLSPTTRRRLHQTIGEALEAAHSSQTLPLAGELAAHFARSGDVERAIRYHREAATHAGSRFAYQEARFHLESAADAMRSQPETPERLRQEMRLLEELGWTLFAMEGFGYEGAARAFARVRDLAEKLDAPQVRFRAMDSLLTVHTMRAEYATVRALGEETILLAGQVGYPLVQTNTRATLGSALMFLGDVESGYAQAELGLEDFDPAAPTIQGISNHLLLAATCAHLGRVACACR